MAEPSTHINYSFEDIQRYLQGKMSAAEMHDIEKAALQDPFLADAIEGFNEADLTTARQHLNEINASLIKKKKESKVVSFNKRSQWLNVAALIIVLAGIGVVASYFFQSSNKQNQVAQLKKEPLKNSTLPDSATVEIKSSTQNRDTGLFIAQNKQLKKAVSPVSKQKNPTPVDTEKDLQNNNEDVVATVTVQVQNDKDTQQAYTRSMAKNENNDTLTNALPNRISGVNIAPTIFAGKVVDEKNQPVAGAVVEAADKSITVITDNNGNFSLFRSDTTFSSVASSIGYETTSATLKPGNNNLIKLAENSSVLNDVVVVGYGTSKKINSVNKTPEPVGGWQSFNNYVLTKLNKDTTSEAFVTSDDLVEMEFLIDDDGNPYDIKITKTLDEKRNAEAVDILKNGPKWTSATKKKKAKVSISF